jgi:hypothetical protein
MQEEFQAGRALGRGFGIWIKNLPSFLILAFLIYLPALLYTGWAMSKLGATFDMGDVETIEHWGWAMRFGGIVLDTVATAAILYGVIQQLRGSHAGIGESIGIGIKRMLPVLGVSIVAGLAIVAGLIALIVPGIIIACMLYVAVPVAVVERPGVGGSLKRSHELTKGYKLQIFGILLVIKVIEFIVYFVLQNAFVSSTDPKMGDIKIYFWAVLGLSIVFAAMQAAINGVVYHDLRVAKEGVATEDLARVFE